MSATRTWRIHQAWKNVLIYFWLLSNKQGIFIFSEIFATFNGIYLLWKRLLLLYSLLIFVNDRSFCCFRQWFSNRFHTFFHAWWIRQPCSRHLFLMHNDFNRRKILDVNYSFLFIAFLIKFQILCFAFMLALPMIVDTI